MTEPVATFTKAQLDEAVASALARTRADAQAALEKTVSLARAKIKQLREELSRLREQSIDEALRETYLSEAKDMIREIENRARSEVLYWRDQALAARAAAAVVAPQAAEGRSAGAAPMRAADADKAMKATRIIGAGRIAVWQDNLGDIKEVAVGSGAPKRPTVLEKRALTAADLGSDAWILVAGEEVPGDAAPPADVAAEATPAGDVKATQIIGVGNVAVWQDNAGKVLEVKLGHGGSRRFERRAITADDLGNDAWVTAPAGSDAWIEAAIDDGEEFTEAPKLERTAAGLVADGAVETPEFGATNDFGAGTNDQGFHWSPRVFDEVLTQFAIDNPNALIAEATKLDDGNRYFTRKELVAAARRLV